MTSHCQLPRSTWKSFEKQPWLLSQIRASQALRASCRSSLPFSACWPAAGHRGQPAAVCGWPSRAFPFSVCGCCAGLGSRAVCRAEQSRRAPRVGTCVAVAVLAGEWQSNTTVRGDVTLSLCARPLETVDSNLHLSLAECF